MRHYIRYETHKQKIGGKFIMKNKFLKPVALSLCAALLIGGVSATVYAKNSAAKADGADKATVTASDEESTDTASAAKDETVYVLAGADGSVKKIIVSDWIKNAVGSKNLTDKSELKDVVNVKGEETYTMGGDNTRVWDAEGNDIYYQGNIEKELPVNLAVSYKLDGASITADKLAGKSGKVTIRFDYTNNQYETVSIDGKQEKIYVPFAMITGMLLDNDVFTNIEVTNGKLINDGNHTAVAGIAFPGLSENLALSSDKIDIPDYVEITADVKNFKMTNTVTIATNEIFNKIDTDNLNSVDDLTASLDKLTGAMNQLMDGSSELYGGLCTLLDKSAELVSGIDKLAAGAAQLKDGASSLDSGADTLNSGAAQLNAGLSELTANNDALNGGAKQVFESLLSMADSKLAEAGLTVDKLTIENYSTVLGSLLENMTDEKLAAQVNAAVKAEVTKAVTEGTRKKLILTSLNMTEEQYNAAVAAGQITDAQIAALTAGADAAINSNPQVQAAMQAEIDAQMQSPEVQAKAAAALENAKASAQQLVALKEQLDSYNYFYTSLGRYTAGVSSANDGAAQLSAGTTQLKAGTVQLKDGINELYNGILTMKNGAPALTSGVTQLKDGSMKLSDGLKQFNEQGVKKLTDAVNGDLGGLITRIKATADVSKNYRSFSGISDDMDGQVKFIYRTDAVESK